MDETQHFPPIDESRFRTGLRRAVFTPWLLLVALAIILTGQIAWMASSSGWVEHTDLVIGRMRVIRRLLTQMVSGQRGYLLTGDRTYREPYNANLSEVPRQLDALWRQVGDNPGQMQRLDRIRTTFDNWTEDVRQEFALKDRGGEYLSYFQRMKQKGLADRLDTLTDQFIAVEEDLRDERVGRARSSTIVALLSAFMLTIGMGGVLGSLTRREMMRLSGTYSQALDVLEEQAGELRRSNEELEQRVRERTAELEAANKELEAFSYSVSHDLRAPVRSVDGFSQALVEDYGDQLAPEAQDYLNRIRANSRRMGELIDDLLKLSRVTRAEIVRTPVDLSALARDVAAKLQETAPDRCAQVDIQDGLTANADPQLMKVVLENLLGNAWKFTAKQPESDIRFGGTERPEGKVFFVSDNGAGFDMKYASKLFGAFQRLHGTAEFEGTGIGLATVHRIIHRHGGRVWAEGEVGKGATFYFTLP